jgi:hypothetical protein
VSAVNKWTTVVVPAAAGFEFLTVGKRGGEVCSIPVIAWELLMGEGGYEGWRPIPMGFMRGDPDNMAFAVRSPDGRVYTMGDHSHLSLGSTHASVEAWTFSVRARTRGHDLEGTA